MNGRDAAHLFGGALLGVGALVAGVTAKSVAEDIESRAREASSKIDDMQVALSDTAEVTDRIYRTMEDAGIVENGARRVRDMAVPMPAPSRPKPPMAEPEPERLSDDVAAIQAEAKMDETPKYPRKRPR